MSVSLSSGNIHTPVKGIHCVTASSSENDTREVSVGMGIIKTNHGYPHHEIKGSTYYK